MSKLSGSRKATQFSSFYRNAAAGRTNLRFCFCKRDETLLEADRRLEKLASVGVH